MSEAVKQGAELIVRLNPFSVVLCDAAGAALGAVRRLERQKTDTLRTLAVVTPRRRVASMRCGAGCTPIA